MTIDPVCGMTVDPAKARGGSFEHAGTTYYFCSPGCRTKFAADPDGWLKSGPKGMGPSTTHNLQLTTRKVRPPDPEPKGTEWTCPMHPEVVKPGPGDCPICGMALEPMTITAADRNPELVDMTRRFWVAAALLPLLLLSMGGMVGSTSMALFRCRRGRGSNWHSRRQCVSGRLALPRARPCDLRTRNLNMFTLIGLGVVVAYLDVVGSGAGFPGVPR